MAKFADPEIADAVTLARAMSREPVAAGDRLRASTFSQGWVVWQRCELGVDGPGSNGDVGGLSCRATDLLHRREQTPFEVLGECGFPSNAAGLL